MEERGQSGWVAQPEGRPQKAQISAHSRIVTLPYCGVCHHVCNKGRGEWGGGVLLLLLLRPVEFLTCLSPHRPCLEHKGLSISVTQQNRLHAASLWVAFGACGRSVRKQNKEFRHRCSEVIRNIDHHFSKAVEGGGGAGHCRNAPPSAMVWVQGNGCQRCTPAPRRVATIVIGRRVRRREPRQPRKTKCTQAQAGQPKTDSAHKTAEVSEE